MNKTEPNFMEHLKPLLPAGGDANELEAAAQALAGLSPEDRIKERLEQSRKECANQSKAQPHREKPAPER